MLYLLIKTSCSHDEKYSFLELSFVQNTGFKLSHLRSLFDGEFRLNSIAFDNHYADQPLVEAEPIVNVGASD
jgi:hypothetical protein